jgi:hypothetical protein
MFSRDRPAGQLLQIRADPVRFRAVMAHDDARLGVRMSTRPLFSSPPRARVTASSEYGRRSCLHATYLASPPPKPAGRPGLLHGLLYRQDLLTGRA